jgi:hypothetical protein
MKLTKKSVVIQELPSGQYRVLTPEERQEAVEKYERRIKLEEARALIKKELNKIAKTCKHPACVDEPGYTYHQRICLICGNISLV